MGHQRFRESREMFKICITYLKLPQKANTGQALTHWLQHGLHGGPYSGRLLYVYRDRGIINGAQRDVFTCVYFME